ncbi:c-type cytochrome [Roseivivax sp. CAU 1761]
MTRFSKRRFSTRADVNDPEFTPYEPSRRFPWPFLAFIIAVLGWGGLTLYQDSRWADSATLQLLARNVGERQAAPGDRDVAAREGSGAAPQDDATGQTETRERAGLAGNDLFGDYCATCHQANGSGVRGAIPPLAGSRYVVAEPEVPVTIVLRGISGPIEVRGEVYDGRMPSFAATLSDEEIAAILTYARSAWGNAAGDITPERVRGIRAAAIGDAVSPLAGGAEIDTLFAAAAGEDADQRPEETR